MSYPMNEFVTDPARSEETSREWFASPANLVETACHEADNELSSVMGRGGDFYKTVRKRVARGVIAANAVMHNHPYPPVLIGTATGLLIGYLVARRLNGRSG